jgi:hypothetical protein
MRLTHLLHKITKSHENAAYMPELSWTEEGRTESPWPESPWPDLPQLIENARREWRQAYELFNEARDPEMVDHAIHVLTAAELRYSYFIRQAKKEHLVDQDCIRLCGFR